ncbi:MAG: hypothetical protein ACAH12_03475 [Methylophilaceae bacterium]
MNTVADKAVIAQQIDSLFVTVPETTLSNGKVVPAFMVAKFSCSQDENGKLTLSPTLKPWVNITFDDAKAACIDAGYQLETESQRLAIIQNVLSVPENWTKGIVGQGKMKRGLRKDSVSSGQPADYVSSDTKQIRALKLTNGEEIFDINGNVYNYLFDDIQGDENGYIAKPFSADSLSLACPYPSEKKGMGWRPDVGTDWSGHALVRGGYWNSGDNAGVFYLRRYWLGDRRSNVSFRCTKSL